MVDANVEIDAVEFFAVGSRFFDFLCHDACTVGETYDLRYKPEECAIGMETAKVHKRGEWMGYFVDYAIAFE